MGRLFWKFFFSILLAQLAATLAIGGAVWLKNREPEQTRRRDIDTSPPAEMAIEAAAATLAYGGPSGLQQMLENMPHHRVYAVDDKGKELLGRIVNPAMLHEAQTLLDKGDQRVVRHVSSADGRRFLLFLPSREHMRPMDGSRMLLAGAGIPLVGMPDQGAPRPPGGAAAPDTPGVPGTPDMSDASGAPGSSERGHPPGAMQDWRDPRQPRLAGLEGSRGPGGPNEPGGDMRPPRFRPLTPWVPIAAAVVASLLFAALLAWYFSRPIRSLRQAFEAASQGDLAPRFGHTSKRGDELNALGHDFDRMTARLQSLMDGQTRLLHDVSHELRSPLARLQAAIGLAHQQPDKMHTTLERIERESMRMDKLVGELLTLSRLEAGALSTAGEEISLAELLDEIIGDAEFEAATHGRAVVQNGTADGNIIGQPALLARAIENVVRNAIKHSPVGGKVDVELARDDAGRQLRIRVMDRGPGVQAEDLQAIFQPFYRSSNTQNDVEGHGLGLAIAQQVVQQHGGSIEALNREDGGLCVEIALPLARTA